MEPLIGILAESRNGSQVRRNPRRVVGNWWRHVPGLRSRETLGSDICPVRAERQGSHREVMLERLAQQLARGHVPELRSQQIPDQNLL
jgi:hypothetical protein